VRIIGKKELKKRGCNYCLHKGLTKVEEKKFSTCPYDVCPYKVLDKYNSYEEFLKKQDFRLPLIADYK